MIKTYKVSLPVEIYRSNNYNVVEEIKPGHLRLEVSAESHEEALSFVNEKMNALLANLLENK